MPNFPSTYLELQAIWKKLRSVQDQTGGIDDLENRVSIVENDISTIDVQINQSASAGKVFISDGTEKYWGWPKAYNLFFTESAEDLTSSYYPFESDDRIIFLTPRRITDNSNDDQQKIFGIAGASTGSLTQLGNSSNLSGLDAGSITVWPSKLGDGRVVINGGLFNTSETSHGSIYLNGGKPSGEIYITAGDGLVNNEYGGRVVIKAGTPYNGGIAGEIELDPRTNGKILLQNLPVSDGSEEYLLSYKSSSKQISKKLLTDITNNFGYTYIEINDTNYTSSITLEDNIKVVEVECTTAIQQILGVLPDQIWLETESYELGRRLIIVNSLNSTNSFQLKSSYAIYVDGAAIEFSAGTSIELVLVKSNIPGKTKIWKIVNNAIIVPNS